jgi:hypothetical protein
MIFLKSGVRIIKQEQFITNHRNQMNIKVNQVNQENQENQEENIINIYELYTKIFL